MPRPLFITATDTNVGKTVVTYVLGLLLQKQGMDVGVMKPVQCAGGDAQFLKEALRLPDGLSLINPIFVQEPLSPHLALRRSNIEFDLPKIKEAFKQLTDSHDVILIEGAGGLMVPLAKHYYNADLIRELNAEVVIVSRLGLGTINHTLLTINQAKVQGLNVKGIIFSDTNPGRKSLPEKTNPQEIKRLSGVPVLGIIPYLKSMDEKYVLEQCDKYVDIKPFFRRGGPPAGEAGVTPPLQAWDKRYLWHPFTQMKDWLADPDQPLVIDSAQGVYLIDTNGKRYIDGVSSLWVNVHGHRHPAIDKTIKDQIDKISHSTLLGLVNTPSVQLARKLIEIAPKGLSKVFYSDNGSTAVEIALKMAYQYWQNKGQKGKRILVHLQNSYHGDTLGSVSVGGIDLFHQVYRGLIFKTKALKGQGWETVDDFEKLLKKKSSLVAALVVEPLIQGAAGMRVWPKGTLKEFRRLCSKYDVFLIADEVATGFGRTGKMFACQQEGVTPDFLCLAKGMTGGYLPLAATLTTKKIYDGFIFDYKDQKTFFHGHTYTGNPLACAAALANLEVFEKERTLEKLAPKIKFLARQLKMFYNLPSVVEVRQCGFMAGIELQGAWEDRVGAKVCQRLRDFGIILRPLGNVVVILPPLVINRDELEYLLKTTYRVIKEITCKGGFKTRPLR